MAKINYFMGIEKPVEELSREAIALEQQIMQTQNNDLICAYLDVYSELLQIKKLLKAQMVDYFIERNNIDNENDLRIQFHYIVDIILADENVGPKMRGKALKYLQLMTLQERMEKFMELLPDNYIQFKVLNVG